jgi:hypothetical protein
MIMVLNILGLIVLSAGIVLSFRSYYLQGGGEEKRAKRLGHYGQALILGGMAFWIIAYLI